MADIGRPGWQWTGNPLTGELERVDSAGNTTTATVEALTNGIYTFASGRLFSASDHRIRWNTSQTVPFYFTQLEGDQFHLLNPTSAANANARINSAGGYVFTYGASVTMPNGEVRTIEDGITYATPVGARLAIRMGLEGSAQYAYVRAAEAGGAYPDQPPFSGYRWATSDETATRSIISALLRNHHEIIEDAIAQGLTDADGNLIEDDYTAAEAIYAMTEFTYDTFAQAIFSYGG